MQSAGHRAANEFETPRELAVDSRVVTGRADARLLGGRVFARP
jgi:hypothetical protein